MTVDGNYILKMCVPVLCKLGPLRAEPAALARRGGSCARVCPPRPRGWAVPFSPVQPSDACVLTVQPHITQLNNETTAESGQVTLTCEAEGEPLPEVTWKRAADGVTFSEGDKVTAAQ